VRLFPGGLAGGKARERLALWRDRQARGLVAAGDGWITREEMQQQEESLRRVVGEMVRIPGGEFDMGSNNGDNERPMHRVRVNAFAIGKSEVTQAQWRAVMGNNPAKFTGCDNCPVEQVSWNDVQDYLRKAASMTGMALRLPTEAEWEYAAGGGTAHQRWAGTESESDLGEYAWYGANAGDRTHPVCQ